MYYVKAVLQVPKYEPMLLKLCRITDMLWKLKLQTGPRMNKLEGQIHFQITAHARQDDFDLGSKLWSLSQKGHFLGNKFYDLFLQKLATLWANNAIFRQILILAPGVNFVN
jgi:hypothetical protein